MSQSYFKFLGNVGHLEYTAEEYKGEMYISYGSLRYYKLLKTPPLVSELMLKIDARHAAWVDVVLGATVKPHTDHNLTATCNVYVDPQGCLTQFYEPGANAKSFAHPGEKTNNIYLPDGLNPVTGFIANPGDVYLLNVTKVHSVIPQGDAVRERAFIQFAWTTTPYEALSQKQI